MTVDDVIQLCLHFFILIFDFYSFFSCFTGIVVIALFIVNNIDLNPILQSNTEYQ